MEVNLNLLVNSKLQFAHSWLLPLLRFGLVVEFQLEVKSIYRVAFALCKIERKKQCQFPDFEKSVLSALTFEFHLQ